MLFFINRIIIICIIVCLFSCKTNEKENNEEIKVKSSLLTSSKTTSEQETNTEFVTYSYSYKKKVGAGEEHEIQELKVQWNDSLNIKFKITMDNSMCEMKDKAEASLVEKNTYKVKNHPVLKKLKFDNNKNEVRLICDYGEYADECDPMDNVIMKNKSAISVTGKKNALEEEVLEEEEVIEYETIYHIKKRKFSTDCTSDDYAFFLVGGQFKTKNIFFNTRLKKINETEFYLYFLPPLLDPVPSGLKDVASFSLSKSIAKANHIGGELQFEWYGFYNRKTRKREFKKNPFTNKIENGSIVLKWCDIGNVDEMGFN